MADNAGMYVTNRDVRIATTAGHVILFEKDVPIFVPETMREEAQMRGAAPVNGEAYSQAEAVKVLAPTGVTRTDKIREIIAEMIVEKDPAKNFTATGLPNAKVIEKRAGFSIDSKERNRVWKSMQAEGVI